MAIELCLCEGTDNAQLLCSWTVREEGDMLLTILLAIVLVECGLYVILGVPALGQLESSILFWCSLRSYKLGRCAC